MKSKMHDAVEKAVLSLLEYCRTENWAGYDPYDGLNSRLLGVLQLTDMKVLRLLITQLMKRLPINLRRIFCVPKGENPKAHALFCSSLLCLMRIGLVKDEAFVRERLQRLLELRSPGYKYYCWGYNFDWQGRSFYLPKFMPNIICTTFAGNALLDAYDEFKSDKLLDAAVSAGKFIINKLNRTEGCKELCFSYTPLDLGQVHNANLLGAAFIARLFPLTSNREFRDIALNAARFSLNRQSVDGSWPYGEAPFQRWVDNFHTGYNLVALNRLAEVLPDQLIDKAISKGLDFYLQNFFTVAGTPKYYANKLWPVDIHCAAQSIVTLRKLYAFNKNALPLSVKVCTWTLLNMRSKRGFFYYQKTRLYMNRISYMRWSQSWMLYALVTFLAYP